MENFCGRVKTIDFITGKIEIANKAKDYFYCPYSLLKDLTEIVLSNKEVYLIFELDGKIIVNFSKRYPKE